MSRFSGFFSDFFSRRPPDSSSFSSCAEVPLENNQTKRNIDIDVTTFYLHLALLKLALVETGRVTGLGVTDEFRHWEEEVWDLDVRLLLGGGFVSLDWLSFFRSCGSVNINWRFFLHLRLNLRVHVAEHLVEIFKVVLQDPAGVGLALSLLLHSVSLDDDARLSVEPDRGGQHAELCLDIVEGATGVMPLVSLLPRLEGHHELCLGGVNFPEENSILLPSLGAQQSLTGGISTETQLRGEIFDDDSGHRGTLTTAHSPYQHQHFLSFIVLHSLGLTRLMLVFNN